MKSSASEPGLLTYVLYSTGVTNELAIFYAIFLLLYYKVLDFELNMLLSFIIVSFLRERNPLVQRQSLLYSDSIPTGNESVTRGIAFVPNNSSRSVIQR